MNILIVSAMFPPIRTGTSFYTQNLAEALTVRGNKVVVVTVDSKDSIGDSENQFKIIRLKSLHFNLRNMFKHLSFCSFFPGNYTRMRSLAGEFDVILLVNHYLDIAFPAIFASLSKRVPLIISVGTQIQSAKPLKNLILNMLDKIICGGLVFPFSKKIIAWDSEIIRYLTDVQGRRILKKVAWMPYGVNGNPVEITSVEHDYMLDEQILGVGAVIEQRNFIFLIRVFARLLPLFPKIKLKIIGHIYYDIPVKLVKKLGLEGKVVFTGEQDHETVLGEMRNSVLFWGGLAAGRYSGLGTATIEAMLSGLPTFASAPANLLVEDKIEDMIHFLYCDGKNEDAAVERIALILEDKYLRKKIGTNARAFVLAKMSWSRVAQKFEQIAGNVFIGD